MKQESKKKVLRKAKDKIVHALNDIKKEFANWEGEKRILLQEVHESLKQSVTELNETINL